MPFCVGGALFAAAIPLVSELLQRLLWQLLPQPPSLRAKAGEGGTAGHSAPHGNAGHSPSSRLGRSPQPDGVPGDAPEGNMREWRVKTLRALVWLLPSGIGFAVGMYVPPKFTIPRVIGSCFEQSWRRIDGRTHRNLMVIVASGLVLGEGIASIVLAVMQAACKHSSCRHVFGTV